MSLRRIWGIGLCIGLLAAAAARAAETAAVPRPDALAVGGARAFEPLPPFAAGPQPPSAATIIPIPIRPWLPPPGVFQEPRLLATDRQQAVPQRPLPDAPAVAAIPVPFHRLHAGLPAYAAAADPARVTGMPLGTGAASPLAPRRPAVPAASPIQDPRRLPSDGQQPAHLRPAGDSPPIAWASDPFAPRPPQMPTTLPAYGVAPDPVQAPLLSAGFLRRPDRPAIASDPTEQHSRLAAIVRSPELQRPPAGFLRLRIPDPFEFIPLVRLANPLPESDPPSRAPGLPGAFAFETKP